MHDSVRPGEQSLRDRLLLTVDMAKRIVWSIARAGNQAALALRPTPDRGVSLAPSPSSCTGLRFGLFRHLLPSWASQPRSLDTSRHSYAQCLQQIHKPLSGNHVKEWISITRAPHPDPRAMKARHPLDRQLCISCRPLLPS